MSVSFQPKVVALIVRWFPYKGEVHLHVHLQVLAGFSYIVLMLRHSAYSTLEATVVLSF